MKPLSKTLPILLFLLLFIFPSYLFAGAVSDTYETNQNTVLNANVLDNDSGWSKEVRTYTTPSHGTINVFYANGYFSYTPDTNYNGTDTFTYKMRYIKKGKWKYKTATVYITVISLEIPPVITPATFTINAKSSDGTLVGQVQTNPLATTFEILTGNIDSIFSIDNSGNITVTNITTATATSYALSIKATNAYGSDTKTITVNLVNETEYINGTHKFNRINPDKTVNIIGNTQIIGNTVECVTTTVTASSSDYSSLVCNDEIGNYNNNNYTVKYINIDATKINSSSATLQLPSTFDKVAWVGLFWQGYLNNNSRIDSNTYSNDYPNGGVKDTNANKIQFKIDDAPYQDIIADKLRYLADSSSVNYSAFSDVTQLFSSYAANSTVKITIANIATSRGHESGLGNYGAWTLVMVYKEDELNTLSKLRNNSIYEGYKVISKNNPDTIQIADFLLPKKGSIDSQMAVFAAEGEYRYKPDTMELDGVSLGDPDANNVFDARLSSSILRNPSMTNNDGIDIDVFDTSAIMEAKRDADPTATSYSSEISLTSGGDTYLPSMVSFTTELYKPRVCYYIDTIVDSAGNNIFENAAFVSGKEINSGEEYTFNFLISNMKKNPNDTDIEVATKVQVYLNMNNFNYTSNTTNMLNIGKSSYEKITDQNATTADPSIKDDLGEYSDNQSIWRVGEGASKYSGGTLDVAENFSDTGNIVKINLKASITTNDNVDTIDLLDFIEFKASFQTSSITIGEDNAQLISQCQDLNSSGSVGTSPNGSYNAVETNFIGEVDPLNVGNIVDPKNYIKTKIVNKPFMLSILSLDHTTNTTLTKSTTDVNVSVITTPIWTNDEATDANLCDKASPLTSIHNVTLRGLKSKDTSFTALYASQDASIRITYDINKSVCSRDVFAIRPYSFATFSQNQYKQAGEDFNITIKAIDENNSNKLGNNTYAGQGKNTIQSIQGYTALLNTLNISAQFYQPTATEIAQMQTDTGLINVSTCPQAGIFTMNNATDSFINGEITASLKFSETGILDLNISEKSGQEWALVDANDTLDNQRYIKPSTITYDEGDISKYILMLFVPYTLETTAEYNSTTTKSWVYMNDINGSAATPQMAAYLSYKIVAKNKNGDVTQNYTKSCFPDTNEANCPRVNGLKLNTTFDLFLDAHINSTGAADLSFYTEDNNSLAVWTPTKNQTVTQGNNNIQEWISPLQFTDGIGKAKVYLNIDKKKNQALNPVNLKVVDINTSTSWMANPGSPKNFTGQTLNVDKSFVYGRTNAPRQRFTTNTGDTFIYYETFCNGTDIKNNICQKNLLPDNVGSTNINDPRWFVNTKHSSAIDGVAGTTSTIVQKNSLTEVSTTNLTSGNPEKATLHYAGTSYPYKTTMQNTPSTWLIYDKYKTNPTSNEFEVEFINTSSSWAGKKETNTTTNPRASDQTNRRSMW